MPSKLKVAVLGASGYSGAELARILHRHPFVETPLLLQRENAGKGARDLADEYPILAGNGGYPLEPFAWSKLQEQGTELLFLATPHAASRAFLPEAMDHGMRVVDLSGAWRLKCPRNRAVYGFHDEDPNAAARLDDQAVYGLPELNRDRIACAALVANPGCYATSVILAVAPLLAAGLVDLDFGIISDSKSGVSGAGKEPSARTHFVSVADNLSAYSVFEHRHTGEILEQLKLEASQLIFTPHLLPIPRGILSTIYLRLRERMTSDEIESCVRSYYKDEKWVRIFGAARLPEIRFCLHTNYCDLGFRLAPDGQRLVLVSCVDNLLKGAAGQAVQNMNIMYGWNEAEGLQ